MRRHRVVIRLVWIALAIAAASAPWRSSAVGFRQAPDASFGDPVLMYAAGDADGDGHDDLAGPRSASSAVAMLWNQGGPGGQFDAAVDVALSFPPRVVALADLDRDGLADLVVAGTNGENRIVVKRALGGRSFAAETSYPVPLGAGPLPPQVAAGDLDGDGFPELVAASGGYLRLFRNDGDGTFSPLQTLAAPADGVEGIRFGNLDSVPGTDVLLLVAGGAKPYRNTGSGPLVEEPRYSPGTADSADGIDTNRDGILDLAVFEAATVWVHENDGSGSFTAAGGPFAVPPAAHVTGHDDVNGDGLEDLVLAGGGAQITVLYADGASGFTRADRPAVANVEPLALGDFNGDGRRDDLALNTLGPVSIWLAGGVASLSGPDAYPVGDAPVALASGDLDGDGDQDLVSADAGARRLTLLENDGSGGFVPWTVLDTGDPPRKVRAMDLDGDGRRDLVALLETGPAGAMASEPAAGAGAIVVFTGLAAGGFGAPQRLSSGQGPMDLWLGDLDGDGAPDAVTADVLDSTVSLFQGSAGGFVPATSLAAGLGPSALAAADFDLDLDLDLVACGTGGSGQLALFVNGGGLAFTSEPLVGLGVEPIGLVAIDLDRDGLTDLAVIDRVLGALELLHNDGGLSFSAAGVLDLGGEPTAIAAGDLNCDDAEDVVVTVQGGSGEADRVLVFLGEGTGALAPPSSLSSGMGPSAVAAADLDRRGAEDLVVLAGGEDRIEVVLNAACTAPSSCVLAIDPASGCAGETVRIVAPAGYARYAWSEGTVGAELVLALPGAGPLQVALTAYGAGCRAEAVLDLEVVAAPALAIETAQVVACAADAADVTFDVTARVAPGSTVAWSVAAPGEVADPAAPAITVRFPAGTPPGEYALVASATGVSGCPAGAAITLRLVEDGGIDPDALPPNRLRLLALADGAVRLAWEPGPLQVFELHRSRSGADLGAAGSLLAGGIGAAEAEDRPPAGGAWFYAVRGTTACPGPGSAP